MKRLLIAMILNGLFLFSSSTLAQHVYNYVRVCDYDEFWNVEKNRTETESSLRLVFRNGGESVAVYSLLAGAWRSPTGLDPNFCYERNENGWDVYYQYQTITGAVYSNYVYVKRDRSFVRFALESKFADIGWKSIKAKSGYKLSR